MCENCILGLSVVKDMSDYCLVLLLLYILLDGQQVVEAM